jgi:hypothetical protein
MNSIFTHLMMKGVQTLFIHTAGNTARGANFQVRSRFGVSGDTITTQRRRAREMEEACTLPQSTLPYFYSRHSFGPSRYIYPQ